MNKRITNVRESSLSSQPTTTHLTTPSHTQDNNTHHNPPVISLCSNFPNSHRSLQHNHLDPCSHCTAQKGEKKRKARHSLYCTGCARAAHGHWLRTGFLVWKEWIVTPVYLPPLFGESCGEWVGRLFPVGCCIEGLEMG